MPTATQPSRCPYRVATAKPVRWLTVLLVSLLGSTTATLSLCGQDIDYRFVDPASHMQPWPDSEAEVFAAPVATMRIAARRRENLRSKRKESPTLDKDRAPKNLSALVENLGVKDAEVLVVPQALPDNTNITKTEPSSQPRDCYQAPPLADLSVNIALPPEGRLPTDAAEECAAQSVPTGDARLVGAWAGTEFHWSATCMRHRPLYFEEINAERYGYTMSYALQPVISAARFFATIPALPYKMAIEHPRDYIYTLGHYRPGSCAPRRWNRLPWQLTAGVVETGFIVGMILLLP